MNDAPAGGIDEVVLDPENPWLGLFSYTEATRAYFHGRDEEAAELARRVQRKTLTVLFGQSGLGKTSLLRAGLVPRLRGEGYCPVYVRIDYAPGSPAPSEQIKQAIFRATADAGHWTRAGSAIEGESLWEFLHHRGDLLRDAGGRTLMPLLIFDQFEEIFTLGQADDAGRLRARQFLEDLADLVENRAPKALEARLERDDSAIDDFDFARADYRVLIALREDYLAHLEGIKESMPSITQNRMRLARMDGAQALSAILKPGGKLVSQEVAESIVRFVAGGSELANAEIEPSLLSLVCRELNSLRQAQGRKDISTDLLAGSRDDILREFYERALADQPAGVRRVIEDELLTESGYRESLAEERVLKALAAAGAAPDALATLVNRRLLRIEERLDMRRVELTHDVLCGVVLANRNLRREREAREEAERALAAQREREAATHRALRRTRLVAGVCAALMLVAVAGALFGWYSMNRARNAEAAAQYSRANAENLVGFLIEDFYSDLAPTGRLETLGKLAQKAVAYYDSLPPELRNRQTEVNRAMALVRAGAAQSASGHDEAAKEAFAEARVAFNALRDAGDREEPVSYGLALILYSEGLADFNSGGGGSDGGTRQLGQAAGLLRPWVYGDKPIRRVRQLYADTLNVLSHTQPKPAAVKMCDEALAILEGLGASDLSDLNAAGSWADTADSKARHLEDLDKFPEAQTVELQVYEMADKILLRRPGDLHALFDRYLAAEMLSRLAGRRYDHVKAAEYASIAARAAEDYVRFNPADLSTWLSWSRALRLVSNEQFQQGQVAKSIDTMQQLVAMRADKRRPSSLGTLVWFQWIRLAELQTRTGDRAGAAQSVRGFANDTRELTAGMTPDMPQRQLLADPESLNSELAVFGISAEDALRGTLATVARVEAVEIPKDNQNASQMRDNILRANLEGASEAAIRLGRFKQAETLARRWLEVPLNISSSEQQRYRFYVQSVIAHAVAMQGRADEARRTLQPSLDNYRQEFKAGARGTTFRIRYAYTLYVSSLAHPADAAGHAQSGADLDEAAKVIAGASPEVQRLVDVQYLSGLIAAARAGDSGAPPGS